MHKSFTTNKFILNVNTINFTKFLTNKSETIMHVSYYDQYIQNNVFKPVST
jgi:hypothetical protein